VGFSGQEGLNLANKVLQGGVIDANPTAVWYETFFANNFIVDASSVWTALATIRQYPASTRTIAQQNVAGPLAGLVEDRTAVAQAVRLTQVAGTNSSTWAAYSTHGNAASPLLKNWLLPQLVPQASGAPSNGYAITLYNGNPAAGGTVVTTTAGMTGTGENKSVGWVFNYAGGLLLLSADFRGQITDPWIVGFRYIGPTAGTGSGPGGFPAHEIFKVDVPRASFTLSQTPMSGSGRMMVTFNGLILAQGVNYDYIVSGSTVSLLPDGAVAGDLVQVYYVPA
jgi:hypothetical protein